MSNKELDHLFKSKLEELEKQPSAHAWDKIQATTKRKKGKGIWFYTSIAAAIVLLIAFGGLFLVNYQSNIEAGQIALNDTDTQPEKITSESHQKNVQKDAKNEGNTASGEEYGQSPSEVPAATEPVKTGKEDIRLATKTPDRIDNPVNTSSKQQKVTGNNDNNHTEGDKPQTTELILPAQLNSDNMASTTDTNKKNQVIETIDATSETSVASTSQVTEANKGQTLTFNIEDFNTSAIVAKAENNNEKKSAIKKVMAFAKNLKEDAGLADLREAKNEIFALNFNKENDNSK